MFSEDRPVGNPAQIFRSFLKNKGLRNTPQRQQIMEVFFSPHQHTEARSALEGIAAVLPITVRPWPAAACCAESSESGMA